MNLRHASLFLLTASCALAAEPASPFQLYAAVGITKAQKNSSTPLDSGLYFRDASGKWDPFGPRILGVASLAVSPTNQSLFLLSAADGVVRSTDAGKSWRKVTGWEVSDVRSIVFDLREPDHAYAATSWGPLRSSDAGATWQLADEGLAKLYCQAILVDSARAGRVLLGTEDGVYVSTDRAHSWKRSNFPKASALRLAQSGASATLMIAGTEGHGAWLSRDSGKSWSATDPVTANANLYAVALSSHDASQLAIGGWETGVRVSTDGGKTWIDRSAGLPSKNIFVVTFDPDRKDRLWASTFEEGAFVSDDLGQTWQDGGLYGSYASDFVFLKTAR